MASSFGSDEPWRKDDVLKDRGAAAEFGLSEADTAALELGDESGCTK